MKTSTKLAIVTFAKTAATVAGFTEVAAGTKVATQTKVATITKFAIAANTTTTAKVATAARVATATTVVVVAAEDTVATAFITFVVFVEGQVYATVATVWGDCLDDRLATEQAGKHIVANFGACNSSDSVASAL